jgi:hypothetical protein
MLNKKKLPRSRVIRVTFDDNQLFKQMLLDLYNLDVFRTPDELADELFQMGLYAKAHTIRESKSVKDQYDKPIRSKKC